MELGLFMMPLHDPRRNYTEMLQHDREAAILADKLGFSEVWVGEHYSCSSEPVANPLQFFATLLDATKNIKFATGVINLPQHHPATVAGDVAQFDHLSKGRFIMGVGPGGLVSDMELFGTMDLNRAEMTTESVDIIHEIWASNPPYNIQGKYWNVKLEKNIVPSLGFGPMLKPFQQPHPPLAIAVMSPSSSSARQAGERGWSIVSANFIPEVHVKSHWEQFVIGCEKAGRRPDPAQWRVARSILVTDSDQEATDYLARPDSTYGWYYDYIVEDMAAFNMLRILKPTPDIPDSDVTRDNCLDWMVMSGSPKTVLDKLVAFVDYVGVPFGTLLTTQKDWENPAIHQKSLRLLSESVMPKLRDYCASLKNVA